MFCWLVLPLIRQGNKPISKSKFMRPLSGTTRERRSLHPPLAPHRRVLVIGNYLADQQQSMLRFADLLLSMYSQSSQVFLVAPPVLIARLPGLPAIVRKYLAYIDKLLIFPIWLTIIARSFDLVHIADHGNAFYTFCCPRRKTIVTCHDLLAIRAALGDSSSACEASPIGIWFQSLIMAGLRRAGSVAFDSHASFRDYLCLIRTTAAQRHAVIPIPLNAPFNADPRAFPLTPAESAQMPPYPYLLMVGSSHYRKNRALALTLLQYLGAESPYRLVFAGASFTESELTFRSSHTLGHRLISIERPSHALLNLLYCRAHALLFPSFAEGFGWPVVEAQVCCCPVIASTTTSIPEVAGEGALYAQPSDVATFATHVRALEDSIIRANLIRLGLSNTRRYDADIVKETYLNFAFQLRSPASPVRP